MVKKLKKQTKSFKTVFDKLLKILKTEKGLLYHKSSKNNNKQGIAVTIDELLAVRLNGKNILNKPTKKVGTYGSGAYRSPFRGRGMEFDEVRIYQEGDDIRCIDWRITAKTGQAHTKVFHEERERMVLVLTDLRPQMRFATRTAFKSVIASKISAIIGWSALENHDRIGGLVLSASKAVMIKAHRSRKRLMGLFNAIVEGSLDSNAKSTASLSKSLAEIKKNAISGSLVFVISDFSDYNEDVEKQLLYLKAHCDVVCIKVYDILEKEPPPYGVYRISDGKNIALMRADDENWRQAYVKLFSDKEQKIRLFCNKYRISFITIRTDDDLAAELYSSLYTQKRNSVSIVSSGHYDNRLKASL
ncbi:MAG: DUF58 domain-containing protein [Alphaproteobacteria bacterium]